MSWINGRRGACVDHRDRGLAYGDGVFETMRVRRGAVRLLDHHLDRLEHGCRRLGFDGPDRGRLRGELLRAAAARGEAVLKLIVTRGMGARGYRPTGAERCTRIVSVHPIPEPAVRAPRFAASVRMCSMRLGSNKRLAGLKTLNRLESVLARAEWRDQRIWEGLMRDADENIVCGTLSNLFLRRGRWLITPDVTRCGVAGVMRRWVMEQAGALQLSAREDRVRWSDLVGADEVFMTNAVAGIVPVGVIHDGPARLRPAERSAATHLSALLDSL